MRSEQHAARYGSDAIADALRRLDLPYLVYNPGASYRGLHDSLVEAGDDARMLLALHEEHAVAIAHGYAKVTGAPLGVLLHSNVGLMHASMALYNAYCDRVPMLVVGATGPLDAARRRPWIDWIHTAADQAALVRHFVKWDDQPGSVQAAIDALAQASAVTRSLPQAPVYVSLDVDLQERALECEPSFERFERRAAASLAGVASPAIVEEIAAKLQAARSPVLLVGRVSRASAEWHARVTLAERFGMRVATDLKTGAAFPGSHPLHLGAPGYFAGPELSDALRDADVVLALDWVDLAGTLRAAAAHPQAYVVDCSLDAALHDGWSKDGFARSAADLHLACRAETLVDSLLAATSADARTPARAIPTRAPAPHGSHASDFDLDALATTMRSAFSGVAISLLRVPLGWNAACWPFSDPLEYFGYDGGAGIGSGPGMAIGAALALRGGERLPVAVLGDGDLLMGCNALWTAAAHDIPLLIVVANNRAYFNDVVHQERVARTRGRALEHRWVGQRLDDPAPDLAELARSFGWSAYGPAEDAAAFADALRAAAADVRDGRPALVDAVVSAGYAGTMRSALS